MKLTTRGRYAVMAMADLASFSKDRPVSLTEISLRQNISLSYLEQLFIKLKQKKLVKSMRGSQGGYTLQVPLANKTLNIFLPETLYIRTLNCKKDSKGCNNKLINATLIFYGIIDQHINSFFEKTLLEDLINKRLNK